METRTRTGPLSAVFLTTAAAVVRFVCIARSVAKVHAASTDTPVACEANEFGKCELAVGRGSYCRHDGYCSNPFESGCLQQELPGWTKLRVCNSNDPPGAAEQDPPLCRTDEFDYMEIRIAAQNWESSFLEVWVLQIILSELLGVPTTIETGKYDGALDLYDPYSRLIPGTANDWSSLYRAHELGDCRLASRERTEDAYEKCAHFIPEVWVDTEDLLNEHIIALKIAL